ncbi:MAG: hypothetical protein ROO73_04515 [Roseivirga sp.]
MDTYEATITVNGKPKTFYFTHLRHVHEDHTKHLREVLKKLESGESVAVDEPSEYGSVPLSSAIDYAIHSGSDPDSDLDIARYLLEHGADVNVGESYTPAHVLCSLNIAHKPERGIAGLTLLLSYGAKLNIKSKGRETALDLLEEGAPWIDEKMREPYSNQGKTYPPAWKQQISPAMQEAHKKVYLTKIAKALLKTTKHKPLDTSFVDYAGKAGVEASYIQRLGSRT